MMSDNQASKPVAAEEGFKRPSIISQVIPYLITGIIFYFIFRNLEFSQIWNNLKEADLTLFTPAMAVFVTAFFLSDVFAFGQAYKWFNAPMTIKEMMDCRAGPYVIQIGLAPLAEALFPLYMWRKKGVRITETLSSNGWTIMVDMSAVFIVLTAAVIYNFYTGLVPQINWIWFTACLAFWIFFFGNIAFWHSRFQHRAADWINEKSSAEVADNLSGSQKLLQTGGRELITLLRTFSIARWHHYLRVFLVRITMLALNFVSHFAALYALGVHPPLPLVLVGVPIIMLSVFLPISVGGYGGPNLLAYLFFVKMVPCGTDEIIAAYILLWQTGFLIGRAFFGLIFIRGFFKGAFPERFKTEEST
jgi:uncharacterized membrane protein YbhN (UPF0104 family)